MKVESVAIDEMWRFVGNKDHQRWLWHAIDYGTGNVLAYIFGDRKDVVLKALKTLLNPFGIQHDDTDDGGAYERQRPKQQQTISNNNPQKIERKHLTLRTRIKRWARRTIGFSKLETLHDGVIGRFVNRFEFGVSG
jgi:insertion element IS1 protein InsB